MEKTKDNVYIIDHSGDCDISVSIQKVKRRESIDSDFIGLLIENHEENKEVLLPIDMDEAKSIVRVLNHLISSYPLSL